MSTAVASPFVEHFWGEDCNGFDVLYHNTKYGYSSSKDLAEFLRESCSVEEQYGKLMNKLAAKQSNNTCSQGSFSVFWPLLKVLVDKLSNLHIQLVHSWQDLLKDVHRYNEEQKKKNNTVKDNESSTFEVVQCIQQTTAALHKAKEKYHYSSVEYEKLRRDGSTSQRDLDKAEVKYKKAIEDYRALVDKYATVRDDFEKKMTDACHRFQKIEEHHIQQMKDFVDTYTKAWEHQHALVGKVHEEFILSSKSLTVEKVLQKFVDEKQTGTEKPGPIAFEEIDLSSLTIPNTTADMSYHTQSSNVSVTSNVDKDFPILEKPSKTGAKRPDILDFSFNSSGSNHSSPGHRSLKLPGFFISRSKREKKKEKKKTKKKFGSNKSNSLEEVSAFPKIDDEGYSIRPENVHNEPDKNSWYSDDSSDSDSDGDDKRKIKVEIKPFSPSETAPSNNVDDIRNIVESLRLSPTPMRRTPHSHEGPMKRSASVSDTLDTTGIMGNKAIDDLIGMETFNYSSTASTPINDNNNTFPSPGHHLYSSTPNCSTPQNISGSSIEFRSESPIELPPAIPERKISTSSIPTSNTIILQGPPSSRISPRVNLPPKAIVRPSGRQSPAMKIMERTESLSNVNTTFSTTSMPIGSSRGPSPLTIGMSDTIPIAVAFSETINALFQGSDEHNVKMRTTGDMMVSFPAGIVRVLMDNPNPAQLSFRVKNISNIEQILYNKQLIIQESSLSTSDSTVYTFEMSLLTEHLKRQCEINKTASYFNIDILKYQIKSHPGMQYVPLKITPYWKCEPVETDFKLDYKYNHFANMNNNKLTNVTIIVPLDGEVVNMQSIPPGTWNSEKKQAVWKLPDLSLMNEDGGSGVIKAKFKMSSGPITPSKVAVQFLCEGCTLSGVDFNLVGSGYRVSLVKKRFVTNKYLAEPDGVLRST